jgi:hypothetical protein
MWCDVARQPNRLLSGAPAVFRGNEILADHNEHKIHRTAVVFNAPKTA